MHVIRNAKYDPPPHLSAESAEFYRQIAEDYQIVDVFGLKLLEQAAECLDLIRECQRIVEAEGMTSRGAADQLKTNPVLTVMRDARAQFALFINRLELEPTPPEPKRRR